MKWENEEVETAITYAFLRPFYKRFIGENLLAHTISRNCNCLYGIEEIDSIQSPYLSWTAASSSRKLGLMTKEPYS